MRERPQSINLVSYFEIPVLDMERAVAFYASIFGCTFERAFVDGNQMAFFPHGEGAAGASGALAMGESYQPSRQGARIYFDTADINATLSKAVQAGASVIYPVAHVGAFGWVAEVVDSEGNCIAFHQT